ncbi:MAG: UbiX family flavin prenyltransferase [Bacteroidales bacterium]|nr:UbiX family flavin prenyltransferase [Bacteroidales bacterium]
MQTKTKNIVVAITGASGSIYAKYLIDYLDKLNTDNSIKINIIFSKTGKEVAQHELGDDFCKNINHKIYEENNFYAPFASGSNAADALIVIPCSMGTLGRIANGTSDNLICRAADVVLKENKKLILVTRETPLNLIHIKNMERVTLAGGVILPANPSFYLKPQTIDDIIYSVIYRVVDHIGLDQSISRW